MDKARSVGGEPHCQIRQRPPYCLLPPILNNQPTRRKIRSKFMSSSANTSPRITRRRVLQGAAGLAVASVLDAGARPARAEETVAKKKRLKQSIVRWCFDKHWKLEQMCQQAKRLGCPSVELVDPKDWPTLQKHGLVCAIPGSHTFEKG